MSAMKVQVNFHISRRLDKELKKMVELRDVTKSHIWREALELYMKCQHESDECPVCGATKKGERK